MNPSTNIEQRITELEIKASFAEDQLDQLDKVIVRQQQQIDALIREITSLRQQAPERSGLRGMGLCAFGTDGCSAPSAGSTQTCCRFPA